MMITSPDRLRLEASSYCQLRCPSCPTAMGTIDAAIGRGFLTAANFENLLDSNPGVREVELSNYGEILLNPELPEILAAAHRRSVVVRADNGVNLNSVSEKALDAIVRHGLRSMTCSIDGASQETYVQYRVRGSFDRVIGHIRQINQLKKDLHSPYPLMTWQFVVFEHNKHELETARNMARDLGMKFYAKLSWDPDLTPTPDSANVAEHAGATSRDEYAERTGHTYMGGICHQLWNSPQINWDGRVLGCCRNFWGDFGGNAFTDGLEAAVNSEKMQYARGMLMGKNPSRDDIPCTTCEIYHSRQSKGDWVSTSRVSAIRIAKAMYRSTGVERLVSLQRKAKRVS
jgi:MoaA/NifB/PqqE/SkfB family radical SAM enzyme